MAREAAAPPELPGYRPVSHLGSGGFADVYLYEQDLPRRRVAVKVLIESAVERSTRQRFVAEANAMARLSAHPSIVTIYFAGIAPDGRPCLVMEYCSRPNLGVRFRSERIAVDEALRVGVRLASAVETAHRAGILHRDIKPANVLITDYGWPALTDFGISAQLDTSSVEAEGLSVPWSAPELFQRNPHTDVRSDVWSLGATIYALLAGRAPFELRGGNNSAAPMIARIERDPLPPLGRDDVGPLLQQVLARAMHKRAEARFRSAYELARALQGVETDLGLPATPIDVFEDAEAPDALDDEAATRLRHIVTINDETGVQVIDTTGPAGGTATAPVGPSPGGPLHPVPDPSTARPPQRVRPAAVLGALGAVIMAAVVAGVVIWGPDAPDRTAEPPATTPGSIIRRPVVEAPVKERCRVADGELTCRWTQPGEAGGVRWQWAPVERPEDRTTVDEPTATVSVDEAGTCLEVIAVDPSGATSRPVRMCRD